MGINLNHSYPQNLIHIIDMTNVIDQNLLCQSKNSEGYLISTNFQDFFKRLPLSLKMNVQPTHYFWQHFQGKHSTTELFKNDLFRIEVLPSDYPNPKQEENKASDSPPRIWRRKSLIYINDILFMYAHAYTEYPSYSEPYFNLIPIQKSLGMHIHKPHIKRSDFQFISPLPIADLKVDSEEYRQDFIGRHSQFIWQKQDAVISTSMPMPLIPPLHLFEYFMISPALIDFLKNKPII
jgi:chorismate-pyruvate lyase